MSPRQEAPAERFNDDALIRTKGERKQQQTQLLSSEKESKKERKQSTTTRTINKSAERSALCQPAASNRLTSQINVLLLPLSLSHTHTHARTHTIRSHKRKKKIKKKVFIAAQKRSVIKVQQPKEPQRFSAVKIHYGSIQR